MNPSLSSSLLSPTLKNNDALTTRVDYNPSFHIKTNRFPNRKLIKQDIDTKNTSVEPVVYMDKNGVITDNNEVDYIKQIEKLKRQLKISNNEVISARKKMEAAIYKTELIEKKLINITDRLVDTEQQLKVSLNNNKYAEMNANTSSFFITQNDTYANGTKKYKVSSRAYQLWSIVRAAFKVSSSISSKGILNRKLDESAFISFLSTNDPIKQKLLYRDVYTLLDRYRILLELMNRMALEINHSKALSLIVEATLKLADCDRVTLYTVDNIKGELECKYSDSAVGWRIPIGKGLAGECAYRNSILNIKDCYIDTRFNQARDKETGYRTNTMLCIPVQDNLGNAIAVIQAINKNSGIFSKLDEDLLQSIANQSGVTLQRAIFFEEEIKSQRRTHALLKIVKAVSGYESHDAQDIIGQIMEITRGALNCDKVSLFQLDTINQELVLKSLKDNIQYRSKLNQGIVGHVATSGETVNLIDVYQDPRFNKELDKQTSYRTKTMLCVPVLDRRQRVVAVVQAINKQCSECGSITCDAHGVEFDSEDAGLVNAFVQEVASILQRSQLETAFSKVLADPAVESGLKNYLAQYSNIALVDVLDHFASSSPRTNELNLPLTSRATPKNVSYSNAGNKSTLFDSPILGIDSFKDIRVNKYIKKEEDSIVFEFSIVAWPLIATKLGFSFTKEEFFSFDFDYFTHCNETQYSSLVLLMFQEFDLLTKYQIPPTKMLFFLQTVQSNYNPNPYHNYLHAFSVVHFAFLLCRQAAISNSLTNLDIFSILVASICHDLQHPGLNNNYLVNTYSDLALRYNDHTVLENHHASLCFAIVQDSNANIFANFSRILFKEARVSIVQSILSTDMARHNELVTELKHQIEVYAKRGQFFIQSSKDDRFLLRNLILHCSDLANPLLPFRMYKNWAVMIFEEMYHQSILESKLGLPSLIKIDKASEKSLSDLQINFLNYIIYPLWEEFANVFDSLTPMILRLHNNKEKFLEISKDSNSEKIIIIK